MLKSKEKTDNQPQDFGTSVTVQYKPKKSILKTFSGAFIRILRARLMRKIPSYFTQ